MNQRQYMMLEFIEYSIDEYLERDDIPGKITFKQVCLQMLAALWQLHELGMLH